MLKIRYNGVQGVYFLHCFRHRLLPFSTSPSTEPTNDSFATYLVESLGFSKQQSLSTSAKMSRLRRAGGAKKVSDFTFVGNSNSVITFLKQNGLNKSYIRSIVIRDPRILLFNVPKTLEPKLKSLLDLGVPMSDLGPVIVANPSILRSRLNPAIEVLKQVLGTNDNVARLLKGLRRNFLSTAVKRLVSNVELLESYGVSRDVILKHILFHPNVFSMKPENLRAAMLQVEHKLGIPPRSGLFCYGLQVLIRLSEKSFDSKFRVFKSCGWAESDVRQIIMRSPTCLLVSETKIKRSLDFLVNQLHYEPAYLATHPSMLNYSLEKRIVPRYRALQVLKEKGLLQKDYALYSALTLTDSKFLEKFIRPFQNVVPNLREHYVVTTKSIIRSD